MLGRAALAAGAAVACSACTFCDRRPAAPRRVCAPGRLAIPLAGAVAAGPPAAAAAADALTDPRVPAAADTFAGFRTSELYLLGTAALCFLAVLVDSGRHPVDPVREPDLAASFTNEENGLLDATVFTLIRGYKRAVSPSLPKNCRFFPTCSEYTAIAIRDFGFVKGVVLFIWRCLRCNPLGGRGYDYPQWPPPAFNAGTTAIDALPRGGVVEDVADDDEDSGRRPAPRQGREAGPS